MDRVPEDRIGPGVARLLLVNAAAFIVLQTVVTAPAVTAGLRFDPALLAARPWTLLSYALVHESLAHLLVTSALLVALGPAVERRMGVLPFLFLYVGSAVGAAGAAVVLATLVPLPPMSGAMGAVAGLLYALAHLGGDREVSLAPLPLETRLVTVAGVGGVALLVAGASQQGTAMSLGHVAACVPAWLFFRVWEPRRPVPGVLPRPTARPRLAPIVTPRDDAPRAALPAPAAAPAAMPAEPGEDPAHVLNRLLDKISASGLESLTAEERRLLTEHAERRKTQG